MEKIRIQKIISDSGFCSRRQAETLIGDGAVKVNGHIVKIGDKADPANDIITVNGEKIKRNTALRYIKLYKPRGYMTSMADTHSKKLITELLKGIEERVYPIGRLDKNSEGLILLTNDGDFANAVMHPKREIEKKYRITVPGAVSDDKIARLATGVNIGEGVITKPCAVNIISTGKNLINPEKPRTVLEIIITEGKNRQIRKMCESVGLEVSRLRRTAVGGVKLGMLKPGEYTDLTKEELGVLNSRIRKSNDNNSAAHNGDRPKNNFRSKR